MSYEVSWMRPRKEKVFEMLSLNTEWMHFDSAQLAAEELERRLELALGMIPGAAIECCVAYCQSNGDPGCDSLGTVCGTYCASELM